MKQADKIIDKNLRNSLQTRNFPKCFESLHQYEEWLDGEAIVHTFPIRRNICEDCKSYYKAQMVNEGRCVNIQAILTE